MKSMYLYRNLLWIILLLSPLVHGDQPEVPTGLCINNSPCSENTGLKPETPANYNPGHYYSVGTTKHTKAPPEEAFGLLKDLPEFKGGKRIYTWKSLEPKEGVYDFSVIEADLNYLASIKKQLWIQIIYTQYNNNKEPNTPAYMWRDSKYGCGSQYYGAYQRVVDTGGWLACSWNNHVRERLVALYSALGEHFNKEPHFEGIAIDETAIDTASAFDAYKTDVGGTKNAFGKAVEDTFKAKALAARTTFPDKVVMQHINFTPYYSLEDFASWLAQNNIGIGGPDIYLSNSFLLETTYPLYIRYHDNVITGQDIQWVNYVERNKFIGRPNTPEELLLGAIKETNPRYIFWLRRDPYFYQENDGVLASIRKHGLPPAALKYYDGEASF